MVLPLEVYCGSFKPILKLLQINISSVDHLHVQATLITDKFSCDEEYQFDKTTSQILLQDDTCVEDALDKYNIYDFELDYINTSDTLLAETSQGTIKLKPC
uniref:Uncharacterized protein n=1 Tax=Megaviridae environmental sample TaxID=1737588 RepID=A0A5J6VJI0_9VIRU|nr:MAG: hypothetical protein [Megaviridae environmental sample]